MNEIKFQGKIAWDYIDNLDAAKEIATKYLIWCSILLLVFSLALISFNNSRVDFYTILCLAICIFCAFLILHFLRYILAYNKLKENLVLYKTIGRITNKLKYPFRITILGKRFLSLHFLLKLASTDNVLVMKYKSKDYCNAGDDVEIIHLYEYIVDIKKIK